MLEAVVFDWAGTLVDFGSRAPLQAFIELFRSRGIEISIEEAREPMGTEKREHITRLLDQPRINAQWREIHGNAASNTDIDKMYQELIPLQKAQIDLCSNIIPGALETFNYLHQQKIPIGTTTGYGREMIKNLLAFSAEQGLCPDAVVTADDVGIGRPSAAAALQNLVQLKANCVHNCVKVDDTEPGIAEGINAGMWAVAVVISGNALGLSFGQWQTLDNASRELLKEQAYSRAKSYGAHYCIDSVADLPEVLELIKVRIARGDKP